jgi:hypothetical protein
MMSMLKLRVLSIRKKLLVIPASAHTLRLGYKRPASDVLQWPAHNPNQLRRPPAVAPRPPPPIPTAVRRQYVVTCTPNRRSGSPYVRRAVLRFIKASVADLSLDAAKCAEMPTGALTLIDSTALEDTSL